MNKEEYFNNIKMYKLLANKSLGQNFLINYNLASDIVDKLDINDDDNVLEIGCGLGSLSYFLVQKPGHISLIDVDERMTNFLLEKFNTNERLSIRRQNILKEDVSSYTKIVGNLPYYITSGIIEYLLLNALNAKRIVLMSQKEVYFKLIDKKEINPLTLLLRYVSTTSTQVNVNRNNFTPIPHVDSCYFVLTINENIKNDLNKEVYNLMKKIFIHRRKTIMNCLNNLVNDKELTLNILHKINIEENKRPEQLNIENYFSLLNILKENNIIIK